MLHSRICGNDVVCKNRADGNMVKAIDSMPSKPMMARVTKGIIGRWELGYKCNSMRVIFWILLFTFSLWFGCHLYENALFGVTYLTISSLNWPLDRNSFIL